MHTVLRHSGRLCTRVSKRRIQRFTWSATQRSSDSKPDDRDKTRRYDTKTLTTKEHEPAEDINENGEGRKTGFRRTLRRKPTDVPKPPALPAWFLRRNVILVSGDRDVTSDAEEVERGSDKRQAVECIDSKSGKTLFTLSCPVDLVSQVTAHSQEQDGNGGIKDTEQKDIASQRDTSTAGPSASAAANLGVQAIINGIYALAGQNLPTFAASRSELSLYNSDPCSHAYMDGYIDTLARTVAADVVRIDANDLADLTEEYVGQGNDSPGTFSTLAHEVFDGQCAVGSLQSMTTTTVSSREPFKEEENEEEEEEEEEDEDESEELEDSSKSHKIKSIYDLLKSQAGNLERGLKSVPVAFSFAIPAGSMSGRQDSRSTRKKSRSDSDYVQWDDARLAAVLEQLIDAPQTKRDTESIDQQEIQLNKDAGRSFVKLVKRTSKQHSLTIEFRESKGSQHQYKAVGPRTIIHIRDLNSICDSKLGEVIVTRLAKVVQKRRRLGDQVMIVGSSTGGRPSAAEFEDSPFIPLSIHSHAESHSLEKGELHQSTTPSKSDSGYHRILEINMRNIGSMLRRLQPNLESEEVFAITQNSMFTPGISMLGDRILPQETVHRLVLTAIGLTQTYTQSETVHAIHIALAISILSSTERLAYMKVATAMRDRMRARFGASNADADSSSKSGPELIDQIKQDCNSHETRLLGGVVDAQNIKTGFDDVHVAPETIEALKTLTTLSLLRPDAFKYGVLAKDNLSGLMLYGPPGTGKTLLAKAVAKESKATVLEVSGAQIYEKYVGEGEKMVRAVFTLAKKLSPCVVFIDEADALFGTRNSASNRSTHRELINQFLREWDGMDDHKVFIMVATNRPFDVDDAVLRRLPRRLLVDLPVAKDRENILGIHLRDETLDPGVVISALAEQTPLYSGSDLKNLCVAAALAAVREENDLVAKHADDKTFALPERRTLYQRHFDKGLQEISASISEDMSSLNAIRKFDEQYGDRKGRRKKASYGFGALDAAVDENAARVRQGP